MLSIKPKLSSIAVLPTISQNFFVDLLSLKVLMSPHGSPEIGVCDCID